MKYKLVNVAVCASLLSVASVAHANNIEPWVGSASWTGDSSFSDEFNGFELESGLAVVKKTSDGYFFRVSLVLLC